MSEEVKKIRPARWIDQHTGIIQPYSLKRAQGAAILEVEIQFIAFRCGKFELTRCCSNFMT